MFMKHQGRFTDVANDKLISIDRHGTPGHIPQPQNGIANDGIREIPV